MSFRINTNIAALEAQEYLRQTSETQAKTIGRVTSGLRILSSGDDAAGLAIANSFRSDQSVLTQGIRNANDGLSTLQTIDGGINNIGKLLDRARTLAAQSASGTFTGNRAVLNAEFQSVIGEIDRQAQSIGLNAGGQFAKSLSVFIGGGKASGGITEISNGSTQVDLTTSTGRAMAGLLAVFAEFDRDILKERVKAGIAQSRAKGKPHGRPATTQSKQQKAQQLWVEGKNKSQISRELGMSRSSVRALLNENPSPPQGAD